MHKKCIYTTTIIYKNPHKVWAHVLEGRGWPHPAETPNLGWEVKNSDSLTQPSLVRDFSGCIPLGVHGFGSIWHHRNGTMFSKRHLERSFPTSSSTVLLACLTHARNMNRYMLNMQLIKSTACRAALITLTLLHPSVYAPHRFNCHCSFNFEQVNLVRRADLSFADGNLCAYICCERTAQWKKNNSTSPWIRSEHSNLQNKE